MGFFESEENMVAYANHNHAYIGWSIDCIWAEQRFITIHICTFLN